MFRLVIISIARWRGAQTLCLSPGNFSVCALVTDPCHRMIGPQNNRKDMIGYKVDMTRDIDSKAGARQRLKYMLTICFFVFFLMVIGVDGATSAPAPVPPIRYSYADIADLARQAPIVIDGTISKAQKLPPEQSTGIKSGHVRMRMTLDLASLIRGSQGSPPRITYLVDVPLTPKGKLPKFKKQRVIIFARPIPGKVDAVQLQSPRAQLAWSPDTDTQVRSILRELLARGAAPHISGITNAFYSAGNLPGEGETQIFLATTGDVPTSLVITRSGEAAPRWAISFGELVDASATQPAKDTLSWYRLACFLPPAIPSTVLDGNSDGDKAQISADYALVRQSLGQCTRSLQ